MSRDYRLYLEDILESCKRIAKYTVGLSLDDFLENTLVYDAVLQNIEIVGEAEKQIPTEIQNQHPELEWRRISGMRDIVAHHYFSMNDEIVRDIVQSKIPKLENQIWKILSKINS